MSEEKINEELEQLGLMLTATKSQDKGRMETIRNSLSDICEA